MLQDMSHDDHVVLILRIQVLDIGGNYFEPVLSTCERAPLSRRLKPDNLRARSLPKRACPAGATPDIQRGESVRVQELPDGPDFSINDEMTMQLLHKTAMK